MPNKSRLRRLFLQYSLGLCVGEGSARQIVQRSSTKWQLSPELVATGAAKKYQSKVDELQQGQLLDTDLGFTKGITTITSKLAAQAKLDYPDSNNWQWEVHSSDQRDESSYCMAGGKIMISRPQVTDLSLTEPELAMLIAHEMAHALLLHNFLEDQEALGLFPSWLNKSFEEFETAVDEDDVVVTALATLGKQQEFEADLSGLRLALRTGYPAKGLLRFYEKLRKRSPYPYFDSRSHPAPAERLQRIRDWLAQQPA